jgi:hypothetical protein
MAVGRAGTGGEGRGQESRRKSAWAGRLRKSYAATIYILIYVLALWRAGRLALGTDGGAAAQVQSAQTRHEHDRAD